MFKTYLRIKRLQRYEEFSIPANFSVIFLSFSLFRIGNIYRYDAQLSTCLGLCIIVDNLQGLAAEVAECHCDVFALNGDFLTVCLTIQLLIAQIICYTGKNHFRDIFAGRLDGQRVLGVYTSGFTTGVVLRGILIFLCSKSDR